MPSASFRHPLVTLQNATPWDLAAANLCAGCPTQPRAEEAFELLDIKLDTFASVIWSETGGQPGLMVHLEAMQEILVV